jgi:hypothetical protein
MFRSFDWETELCINGKVVDFREINIIYGRNYSGKTTLYCCLLKIGFLLVVQVKIFGEERVLPCTLSGIRLAII